MADKITKALAALISMACFGLCLDAAWRADIASPASLLTTEGSAIAQALVVVMLPATISFFGHAIERRAYGAAVAAVGLAVFCWCETVLVVLSGWDILESGLQGQPLVTALLVIGVIVTAAAIMPFALQTVFKPNALKTSGIVTASTPDQTPSPSVNGSGARSTSASGLNKPEPLAQSGRKANEADLAAFLDNHVVIRRGARISAQQFRDVLHAFYVARGLKPREMRWLGRDLKRIGVRSSLVNGMTVYRDIELINLEKLVTHQRAVA